MSDTDEGATHWLDPVTGTEAGVVNGRCWEIYELTHGGWRGVIITLPASAGKCWVKRATKTETRAAVIALAKSVPPSQPREEP